MITREDIKRFASQAKPAYVDALLAGIDTLREAGILESEHRLCHFLAQVGHETGGFTIVRENMNHSVKSARKTWPSRFKQMSDAEIRSLAKDNIRFSDFVYGGRMGNKKGTADAFNFRGAGFIQTTGRAAFEAYAKRLGLPTDGESLAKYATDLSILLKFACMEWKESGCNDWSDENDLTKVCKAINTGSATSNVKPVGMAERQKWFAKAWSIWGDKGKPDVPAEPVSQAPAVTAGTVGSGIGMNFLAGDPVGMSSAAVALKGNAGQLFTGMDLATWSVPLLLGSAVVAYLVWARKT